ncbi:hypothetical protein B0G73_13416 [Paraburkholderia sp. BL25I1N1]|nr:hypothetical protein B0G73_13416 [Paraburkholderia sp. BL25I1N1]
MDCVYEVSKTLVSSLDVAKAFRESPNYLVQTMEWRRAFVVLAEPDGQLRGLSATGLSRDEQQRTTTRSRNRKPGKPEGERERLIWFVRVPLAGSEHAVRVV